MTNTDIFNDNFPHYKFELGLHTALLLISMVLFFLLPVPEATRAASGPGYWGILSAFSASDVLIVGLGLFSVYVAIRSSISLGVTLGKCLYIPFEENEDEQEQPGKRSDHRDQPGKEMNYIWIGALLIVVFYLVNGGLYHLVAPFEVKQIHYASLVQAIDANPENEGMKAVMSLAAQDGKITRGDMRILTNWMIDNLGYYSVNHTHALADPKEAFLERVGYNKSP